MEVVAEEVRAQKDEPEYHLPSALRPPGSVAVVVVVVVDLYALEGMMLS